MLKRFQDGWKKTVDAVADAVAPSQMRLTRFAMSWESLYDNLDVSPESVDMAQAEWKAMVRSKAQICCHAINEILELLEAESKNPPPVQDSTYLPCMEHVLAEKKLDKLFIAGATDMPTGLMGLVLEFTTHLLSYGRGQLLTLAAFVVPLNDFMEKLIQHMGDTLTPTLSARNRALLVTLLDRIADDIEISPAAAASMIRNGVPLPLKLCSEVLDMDETTVHEASILRRVVVKFSAHSPFTHDEWSASSVAPALIRGLWKALATLPAEIPNVFAFTHEWGDRDIPQEARTTYQLKELLRKIRSVNRVAASDGALAALLVEDFSLMMQVQFIPRLVSGDEREVARMTRNLTLLVEESAEALLKAIAQSLFGDFTSVDTVTCDLTTMQPKRVSKAPVDEYDALLPVMPGDSAPSASTAPPTLPQTDRAWPVVAQWLFSRLTDLDSAICLWTIRFFAACVTARCDALNQCLMPATLRPGRVNWKALVIARGMEWEGFKAEVRADAESMLEARTKEAGVAAVHDALADAPKTTPAGMFMTQLAAAVAHWATNSARINMALSMLLTNIVTNPLYTGAVDNTGDGDSMSVFNALGLAKTECQSLIPTDHDEQLEALGRAAEGVREVQGGTIDPLTNSILLDLTAIELDEISSLCAKLLAV
ncbi:Retinoic acid induced 16-like protein [Carpediemonas membranifera]|uniref:Retinoic acid induced 16-like protein n=1 Tax=Carpediemonas membranifera TaxID=201153 RepID=A0A8J6B2A2_9EUKA|nr:Retinoic acid induced 16-like protein [Carpediemonas membranifera]|eukprot:KAG9391457.1 Retinoic acid induced 16-like protein [Carpediemonas membranifera]